MEQVDELGESEDIPKSPDMEYKSIEKPKKKKKKKRKSTEKGDGEPTLFKINAVAAEISGNSGEDITLVEIKDKKSESRTETGDAGKENVENLSNSRDRSRSITRSLSHTHYNIQPRRRVSRKSRSDGFYVENNTHDMLLDRGEIQFCGYENHCGGRSPYIRVSRSTDPAVIWDVLIEEWELPLPDLVLSITGGLNSLQVGPKLRERFKRGIIQTATTTGAWIITGGSRGGIMEFVGEIVRDHLISSRGRRRIVTIGMPTYGYVKNKQTFRSVKISIKDAFETLYRQTHVARYEKTDVNSATDGKYELDHNHTHFVMVGNEHEVEADDNFDCQIELRSSLEKMINSHACFGNQTTQSYGNKIPVIHIVMGGGFHTIKGIVEAVKNGIPIIVMARSGRVADLLVEEISIQTKNSKDTLSERIRSQTTKLKIKEENIETSIDYMTEILKQRHSHLLNIFDIFDMENKGFDNAVLDALLKANESYNNAKLALALAWNRCDIAENIFREQRLESVLDDVNDLMVKALVQNKHEFVGLFLEHGVKASRFADKYNLWNLYSNCLHQSTDKAVELLNSIMSSLQRTLFAHLTCRPSEAVSPDHPYLLTIMGKIIEKLHRDGALNPYPDSKANRVENQVTRLGYIKQNKDTSKVDEQTALQWLFFWAILMNRKEMALQLWKFIPQHGIAAALIASSMFRQMSRYAEGIEELDLSDSITANSEVFENLASGVLTECYEFDKDLSHKVLVQKNGTFGDSTVLFIAESNYQVTFMSNTCCQSLLRKMWKGMIALYIPTIQVILTILCPLLLPFIKFATTDQTWDLQNKENASIFDEPKIRYYNVALCGNSNKRSISFPRAMAYFYFAPIVIFWANLLAYLVFLGVFSIFVLTQLNYDSVSIYEYATYAWIFSTILEQIRQITAVKKKSIKYKIRTWTHEEWHRFDIINNIFFAVSIILRFSVTKDYFVWARMSFSLTLSLFTLRFLEYFFVSEKLGPKVIMIRRMLRDLLLFGLILVVFTLSFGLAYQANLYPGAPLNWDLLKRVVYHPYFQIYGELFLENMEAEEPSVCSRNETEWRSGSIPRCPEKSVLVVLLLAAYMLTTNILLVNLLIAMFAHTFSKVQENSKQIWRFHRCRVVYHYCDSPVLVPPLIVISHAIRLIRSIAMKCCHICTRRNEFRKQFIEEEANAITLFEKEAVRKFLQKRNQQLLNLNPNLKY